MSNQKPLDKALVDQFRGKIKDSQLGDASDEYLNKWLVARNYDIDQAVKALNQSLEWRKTNKADELFTNYQKPEVLNKYFSLGVVGKDKFNCPIWFSAMGQCDLKGIKLSVTKKDYTRFIIHTLETAVGGFSNAKINKTSNQVNLFVDMEGLSMRTLTSKPAVEALLEVFQTIETHYPDTLRRCVIVNSSKIFMMLFNLIKPFLNKATIERVEIYGFDAQEWKPKLILDIDPSQLPAHYGGTQTDPNGDQKCQSKVSLSGEVPKTYFLTNNKPEPKEGMRQLKVANVSKGKLEYRISAIGSTFRWEFMTEGGDIGYRVFCNTLDGEVIELVAPCRVDSHLFMEEGQVTCEHAGSYIIEFNNTFSVLKSKKVHYVTSTEPPADE